jgi:hypothetical protein
LGSWDITELERAIMGGLKWEELKLKL